MAFHSVPKVLILGHSFVKRLNSDLRSGFDSRASHDFMLNGTASVCLHGIGGRTVPKLCSFDLPFVRRHSPDIVILEIGTNDLSFSNPEVVGSAIEDLVNLLFDQFSVCAVGVCHTIPRGRSYVQADKFFERARLLNHYLDVVLEPLPNTFCWRHSNFSSPDKSFYLDDGVHLNPTGQYLLYRSYRGAILRALSSLRV